MNRGNTIRTSEGRVHPGLIAWLEQTRITLPLKGVDCRFHVCGDLLSVEIDQIFHQNNDRSLDCLYSFPLPGGAAVYRCEMHVNDRIVRAVVEEQEKAREIAREKKAAGYRTALVEMERENLFTLSLGNIQPEDLVIIRLAYFQNLTRLQDWTSFHIPFCPGIRYIPGQPLLRSPAGRGGADDTDQVPDASRITPPSIDQLHPDAAALCVLGRVENPEGVVTDLSSPTHPVLIHDGESSLEVSLADMGAVPDRDFVVRWTEQPAAALRGVGWVTRQEDQSYALVRLQAPAQPPAGAMADKDVYFLLDRSGSMHGLKWKRTAQAFVEFVKALPAEDRVWATLYESQFRDFAEKPLSARQVLADRAAHGLEGLGTAGGTELLPALIHVLGKVRKHSAGRAATLMIITDGQVGNEKEILRRLREFPDVRVHTFGIDTAVNDAFLKQIASQQGGTCHLVAPQDDLVGTVVRLAPRLQPPVWVDIKPSAPWELAEDRAITLHANESRCLALKGPASAGAVRLEGTTAGEGAHALGCALQEKAVSALRLFWNKQRIDHFLRSNNQAAAVALAKASNLVCEGTAFVAWDEAEKVTIAQQEIYQPVIREAHLMYRSLGSDARRVAHFCMPAYEIIGLTDGGLTDREQGSRGRWRKCRSAEDTQAEQRRIKQFEKQLRKKYPSLKLVNIGEYDLLEIVSVREDIARKPADYWPVTVEVFDILFLCAVTDTRLCVGRLKGLVLFLQALRAAGRNQAGRLQLCRDRIEGILASKADFTRIPGWAKLQGSCPSLWPKEISA